MDKNKEWTGVERRLDNKLLDEQLRGIETSVSAIEKTMVQVVEHMAGEEKMFKIINDDINKRLERNDKTLYGNGRPGLVRDLDKVKYLWIAVIVSVLLQIPSTAGSLKILLKAMM